MITRNDILTEAVDRCLNEMYKWSQPSIDLSELIKSGFKDSNENPLYRRHYLSQENFKYIRKNYIWAYSLDDGWDKHFDILLNYLTEGGLKDKYIQEEGKPGYRSYEKVPPIYSLLNKEDADTAISLIKECHDFYYKNHDLNSFNYSVTLGCSPTSNKQEVENYWHERPDFKIKDFNIEDIIYGDISEEEFINTLKQFNKSNCIITSQNDFKWYFNGYTTNNEFIYS